MKEKKEIDAVHKNWTQNLLLIGSGQTVEPVQLRWFHDYALKFMYIIYIRKANLETR
jgi:hypothetical protein